MHKDVKDEMIQRCESFYIGSCKIQDVKTCSECRNDIVKYQDKKNLGVEYKVW